MPGTLGTWTQVEFIGVQHKYPEDRPFESQHTKKGKKENSGVMSDLGLPTMRRGREAPPITPPPLVRAICSANFSQGSGTVLP